MHGRKTLIILRIFNSNENLARLYSEIKSLHIILLAEGLSL